MLTHAFQNPVTKVKLFESGWTTDATIYGEISRMCYVKPETGPGKAAIEKYYFDFESNSCKSLTSDRCQGNVPFDTLSLCQKLCN